MGASASPSHAIEARIALESSLEKRLITVLHKALGTKDVIVIVKAELFTSEEIEDEILPGVPVKETPANAGAGPIAMTMLKSLSAVVIVDKKTSKKDLALIERTSNDILGLKEQRGDRLTIETLDMNRAATEALESAQDAKSPTSERSSSFFDEFLKPQALISLMWLFGILTGLLLLYLSFVRPLIALAREALTLKSQGSEKGGNPERLIAASAAEPPVLAHGGLHNGNGNGHNGHSNGAERKDLPFGFITERNLPMLAHMMKRMTPRTTALIAHYLPAHLAGQVLVSLKTEKRREVVQYMTRVTQLQETEVKAIETNVRRKIDYLMGGEDKLAAILEAVPAGMQEELLTTLRDKDPDLGRRLGQRIVTLDDMAFLEPEDIKTLSRRVQLKSIAAVLRAHDEIQSQLLPKLTSGMGEWLSQEIELAQQLPPGLLAIEQKAVISAMSQLVHEGAIILKREEMEGIENGLYDEPVSTASEAEDLEEEGPSFESEMKADPAPPSSLSNPMSEVEMPLPPMTPPEVTPPAQDIGLKPLDPGADLLPGPEEKEIYPPESERRPSRRPQRKKPSGEDI